MYTAVHLLLKTIVEYVEWKTRVANPVQSCTQGSLGIKGKSKGESMVMEIFLSTSEKSYYIYV